MSRLRRIGFSILALAALVGPAQTTFGQGFIIGRHAITPVARTFEIREVSIDARIKDQVAEVQVSQTFHNPGSTEIESEYLFPLPEEGAVQGFVLMVDGKELPGRILPKEEARRIYEEIVRSRRDPALLEYMGRGLYRTSVFPIPPGADRKVTMRYTQVCKRERDVVEFLYPLGTQKFTSKPIDRLKLSVSISSNDPIKSIYSPIYDASVVREGDREAKVAVEQRNVVPSNDFKMVYTLAAGSVGASVLSWRPTDGEDGYFLLLAAPEVRARDAKPIPKTVVFVLDRSGSMAGAKIEQAKKALQFVLNNLKDDDLFNIVVYDDRVETYKPELQRFNSASREEAERFVSNIREGGSTNISEALTTAMGLIKDQSRPNYVIFLTDGLPTAGEVNELKIAALAKDANRSRSRLFVFGVGHDVNARLLDRLSGGNAGTSEYVRPNEDIERSVASFYGKMTRPALSGISVELAGTDINRAYPRDIPDLFDGGQLVWVGRYRTSGPAVLKLKGKVGNENYSLETKVDLAATGEHRGRDFVEKLWVIRRVGYIIDQIDLNGKNKELTDELLALSTKYGILTPYTAFLADERVQLHVSSNRVATERELLRLNEVQGSYGIAQRGAKQGYNTADKADLAGANQLALRARSEDRFGAASASAPTLAGTNGQPAAPGGGRAGLGRMSGGVGGMGGGMGGMGGTMGSGGQSAPARPALRIVGNKSFFRKENRWVDSTVKPEEDAKAVVVEQFSEEFFKIARSLSAESNQYLAFDEAVTVNLDGRVYRFDPPKAGR